MRPVPVYEKEFTAVLTQRPKKGEVDALIIRPTMEKKFFILFTLSLLLQPTQLLAGTHEMGEGLLNSIGISILSATFLAYFAYIIKQPLILAYLAAGIVIGPQMGFGLVTSEHDIEIIAEIGLILLLFMIGLEFDLKKLRESGSSIIITGIWQFILCVAMGLGYCYLLGFTFSGQEPFEYEIWGIHLMGGPYDLWYLAICLGISSTTIVVKLLYSKFELDTLAGRITLGVLVFQDIWAIVILGIQPNLANPEVITILWSFAKGGFLVIISLLISRYLLGNVFKQFAKLPELVLVASLGWCVLVCGIANYFGLSLEMGALIAGAAISTFPYNLDVIAKIVSIRDFFITLFFVALGMQIPSPLANLGILGIAIILALFLIATRFLAVFPLLYFLHNGNRVSLLAAINLSQLSEFALVIASLGISNHHIGPDILTIIVFVFVITSVISTYMISYSHPLQAKLSQLVATIGFKDIENAPPEEEPVIAKEIALLGFFRTASSLIKEMEELDSSLKEKLVVIDLNPVVHQKLQAHGVKVIYGDISHLETLHHAGIAQAKIVISSIPDTMLKGTDNLKIIIKMKKLCPHAKIIVTAESPSRALKMYHEGADYVLLPRVVVADHLIDILDGMLKGNLETFLKKNEIEKLTGREEIIN
ncbi:sodium/hydrogen exchanger [Thioploca ingrica]|uniref:Sodium/hydrogen exchanger n=1 Tax=Thioploca ingrica TaxID=40754 RepID=A0A090AEL3_9GAMM|nr:sodium/hydrogen exchanger [Thioploca ingrica]